MGLSPDDATMIHFHQSASRIYVSRAVTWRGGRSRKYIAVQDEVPCFIRTSPAFLHILHIDFIRWLGHVSLFRPATIVVSLALVCTLSLYLSPSRVFVCCAHASLVQRARAISGPFEASSSRVSREAGGREIRMNFIRGSAAVSLSLYISTLSSPLYSARRRRRLPLFASFLRGREGRGRRAYVNVRITTHVIFARCTCRCLLYMCEIHTRVHDAGYAALYSEGERVAWKRARGSSASPRSYCATTTQGCFSILYATFSASSWLLRLSRNRHPAR